MNQPTPTTKYVALEGIKHGNRFLTSYTPGHDYTKGGNGETWYRILGYGDTHEQAIRLIYMTKADEDRAMRDYILSMTRKMGWPDAMADKTMRMIGR